MGVEALVKAGEALANVFGGLSGIGSVLVVTGLTILLMIGVGFGLYTLIKLIKYLPRMTPWQFLKFVIFTAIALIIIGVVIP
jgi:hypothetical protein